MDGLEQQWLEILRKVDLFKDLSEAQLMLCVGELKSVHYAAGGYLVHEGEAATDLFILIKGTADVIKDDAHVISTLVPGDILGEMALIDGGLRSASARASTPVDALALSVMGLNRLAESDIAFQRVYKKIGIHAVQHLRKANNQMVAALEKQVEQFKLRASMGLFIVYVLTALSAYSFLLSLLHQLNSSSRVSSQWLVISLSIGSFLAFIAMAKHIELPLSKFGLTRKDWWPSLKLSMFCSGFFLLVVLLFKYILISWISTYKGQSLFDPFINFHYVDPDNIPHVWGRSLIVYLLIIVPTQELCARGVLQGSLEHLLVGKNKNLISILISNLLFSVSHLFQSPTFAIVTFIPGIFFGWLYTKHDSLLGPISAHMLLGAWGLWIVGFNFS